MANWDTDDPVTRRTMFYEKVKQGDKELIRFLPFYQVNYPGLGGKVFEPVDCLKRRQSGGSTLNSSVLARKEINEIREMDAYANLVNCEKKMDGTLRTLHSFAWDWPL